MGAQLAARRRQLIQRGRALVLRRTGVADLPLVGHPRAYAPHELLGGLMAGDQQVELLNDEIAAAGWPAPPKKPDTVVIDGHSSVIQGAVPINEGAVCIGWRLWVRG